MIGAIILAAGSSRRFGDDKRKAKLPDGRMVFEQTIETVLTSFDDVLLVLRYGDTDFESEVRALFEAEKLRIFRAPDSALGMGHSLANAMAEVSDWDSVFIFLADMPYIKPATIEKLRSSLESGRIVVPVHVGRYGHPVGFSHEFFDEIAALEGDRGAKPVIQVHLDRVVEVEVDDPGVLQDVDRPEDLSSS
ncbi:MAG: nucleotidyltransferase family protein [Gammaproteobacteria bacterium]|jgi:molybdenum cofactor cytidylyltransferase|nr:nucleotidyltransferase family protein [Gammaproteobacteria bacterium]MBT4492565.1 nucleotidyltransferase family protein [Gammaproteobacteria bacterium]MBT7369015.1 nucleotidyltransferase family protein [Gammaproteobacteria bacterium]